MLQRDRERDWEHTNTQSTSLFSRVHAYIEHLRAVLWIHLGRTASTQLSRRWSIYRDAVFAAAHRRLW
jgi:hypothetical protein